MRIGVWRCLSRSRKASAIASLWPLCHREARLPAGQRQFHSGRPGQISVRARESRPGPGQTSMHGTRSSVYRGTVQFGTGQLVTFGGERAFHGPAPDPLLASHDENGTAVFHALLSPPSVSSINKLRSKRRFPGGERRPKSSTCRTKGVASRTYSRMLPMSSAKSGDNRFSSRRVSARRLPVSAIASPVDHTAL